MNYYRQYKLYQAIKAINIVPKFRYSFGQSFSINVPGLKIVAAEPYGQQVLYKLNVTSDGEYKHIPTNYEKYGFLAAMVYHLFEHRFSINYKKIMGIQK